MNTNQDVNKRKEILPAGLAVRRVLLLVLLIWCFAFALACRLTGMPELQQNAERGLIGKLFGDVRFEISEQFYEQADCVFHKGIGHYKPAAFKDWFARMKDEVSPAGHLHLHKEGVLEIMPWLYFATRANPSNVNAYVVAAYWLAGEAGRPDLAEGVLNEALRNNPVDYRVYMEKGNLALKEGNYGKAARFLDAAFSLLPGTANPDKVYPPMATQDQERIDLAEILTYRGLLYEINASPENALRCYREVTRMFPGRTGLKERIIELEKNGRSPTPPEELVGILLFQNRHVCTENEDG
ncbi:MAG: tetratricopeptide repeat protein [Kiritimatiellia bacterium]|nr:tetratricopeptide repeat protein [Kiritimatiellia bacterium]